MALEANAGDGRPMCGEPTKSGRPCRSEILGDDGHCAMHAGRADPVELGQRSGEVRRELAMGPRERLRRLAEDDDEVYTKMKTVLLEGMEATTSVGVGDGQVIEVPDHRARLAALQTFLSEGWGRPAQAHAVQIAGPGGAPLEVQVSPADMQAALALLGRAGGILELNPGDVTEDDDDEGGAES